MEKLMIKDLKKCNREVDGILSMAKYNELGKYHSQTIVRRFDKWNKAKEIAGLAIYNREGKIEDDEILGDIKRVAEKIDKNITKRDYNKHGKFSSVTISNHFGSWNKAKKEIGLEINNYNSKEVHQFCRDCMEYEDCNIELQDCEYYDYYKEEVVG